MRNDLSRDSSLPTPLLSHSMLLHQDGCLLGKCKGHEWLMCGFRICISRRRHWASWLITGVADHCERWNGKQSKGSILIWHSRDYLLIVLFTYLLTYLLTCLPACLLAYLLTSLLTYLLSYLLTCLLACLLTYLLTYLLSYLLTYLLTCLFACLLSYLLACLLTCLLAYLLT